MHIKIIIIIIIIIIVIIIIVVVVVVVVIIGDRLLTLSELDPIGLHTSGSYDNQVTFHNRRINFHSPSTHRHTVVQVALICESSR